MTGMRRAAVEPMPASHDRSAEHPWRKPGTWLAKRLVHPPDNRRRWTPSGFHFGWLFLAALATLLAGYMFMGRGLAQLGWRPVHAGEVVLFLGLLAAADAFFRLRLRPTLSPVVWLLLGFMVLGFARTVPYLGVYGADALRDAVLWGYAVFALMIYVVADRAIALGAMRLYGWVVPVFAAWLPFGLFTSDDMAVHIVGSLAVLVVGADVATNLRTIAWRAAITVPLLWAAIADGAASAGSLITVAAGVALVAALAFLLRRSRNWVPVVIAPAMLAAVLGAAGLFSNDGPTVTAVPDPGASAYIAPAPSGRSPQTAGSITCEGPVDARSLIGNPGFEDRTVGEDSVEAWRIEAGQFTIVDGGGYRGAHFASMQSTDGPSTATITSCRFPFQANHDVTVSLWAKAIIGGPVLATHLLWYDSSGRSISSVAMNSLVTDGLGTWQQSAGIVTAPTGTTHAEVQLVEAGGNATIGIDEVIVKSATTECAPVPASESPIGNSGFELGTPNDGTIEGWATQAGLYHIVAGGGHRGENFASVQSRGGPSASPATITSCRFPVQADHDVSVSLWARAIIGGPVVDTYMSWYDSSGTRTSSVLMNSFATGAVTTWQESSGVLKAPGGTSHAQVLLREVTGNATIGIDEVIVTTAAPRSLVTNAGFELGIPNSGAISGWQVVSGAGTIVHAGAHSGENFASLQGGDDAYSAAAASSRFRVDSGAEHAVSFQIKAVAGNPTAAVFVNWYDTADAPISSASLSSLPTGGVSSWQESTGVVTAPIRAVSAEILIWEAAGGSATMGIDEVIVRTGDFTIQPPITGGPSTALDQIIEDIVFGDYFWTGRGFGVSLAAADGPQTWEDLSLPAPHDSHLTTLARMGVPGFVLWVLLQGAFGIGLLRSVLRNRRAGDTRLAAIGAWILAYWVAILIATSFDSHLESPQGGIWFWSLFGMGLVVMHLNPTRRDA